MEKSIQHNELTSKLLEFMKQRVQKFDTSFYKKCIDVLEILLKTNQELPSQSEKKDSDIYFFEPLRLFLVQEFDNYYCYVSDHQISENNIKVQRKLNLSDNAIKNLLRQFNAIELNNMDALVSDNYPDLDKIIFIISEIELNDSKIIRIRSKDSLGLFLGYEVLRVIEHQDMQRFIGYIENEKGKKDISESNQMFKEMYGMYKSLDQDQKDRSIFFSGFVLHALGTTYTSDADMIYWAKNDSESDIKKVERIFSKYHKLDYFVHTDERNDIDMTGDILTDPRKHFYFMGMKIVGINIHLQRLYYRASPAAFVDMYMLNKINKFNIKPCFPLMTLRDDPPIIFTKSLIEKKLRTVKKYLREWHGINLPNKKISKIFKKCKNYPNDPPFHKQLSYDANTQYIEINHQTAILLLMGEYFKRNEDLLIIDNVKEMADYGKKTKILFIGPDKERIDELKANNKNENVMFLNKNISMKWDEKHGRYSNILIKHSTNEIFSNKDNFVNNILSVDDINTVIIIIYLDGVLINEVMKDDDMYQIKDQDQTLLFGIYKYDKQNVVIYLKDSQDYYSGRIERIVQLDEIKKIFDQMDYTMVQESTLHAVTNDDKMNKMQKNISEFFRYVVFRKIFHQRGGYIDQYNENKCNYEKIKIEK